MDSNDCIPPIANRVTTPAELELPPDLELALGYRWPIFLARGCSSYSLILPRLSWPTHDRRVIEALYARNLDLNWALQTGPDRNSEGVMSLEIDPRYTWMALTQLSFGDDLRQRTLRFAQLFPPQELRDEWVKQRTVRDLSGYVREMCAEAVDQDFLYKDPSARVKLPKYLRPTDKTTLTWDQMRMALEILDEHARILLELDMTDALRPGELFALRWKCFDPTCSKLVIQETVYKGKIRPWAKNATEFGAGSPSIDFGS